MGSHAVTYMKQQAAKKVYSSPDLHGITLNTCFILPDYALVRVPEGNADPAGRGYDPSRAWPISMLSFIFVRKNFVQWQGDEGEESA